MEGSERAWFTSSYVDRRPRFARRRAGERRKARGRARLPSIQIFNQSPRAWKARVYSDEEVEAFHAAMEDSHVEALVIHAVYLLNCAPRTPRSATSRWRR